MKKFRFNIKLQSANAQEAYFTLEEAGIKVSFSSIPHSRAIWLIAEGETPEEIAKINSFLHSDFNTSK